MRRLIVVLLAAGCVEPPTETTTRQGEDPCEPGIVLRFKHDNGAWATELVVVRPSCDGWGAGWADPAPACGVLADAVRDACEDVTRLDEVRTPPRDTLPP